MELHNPPCNISVTSVTYFTGLSRSFKGRVDFLAFHDILIADGLKELENSMTQDNLNSWLKLLRSREVIVAVPNRGVKLGSF
jgi:hypothetical protein